ncbi:hypothetical protein [Halobacteriovorax sp.]|uniref:hypothetical protein n=1 Tax=Halobacteriovorax sp. TaxID=2020862 RepID=UPI0035647D6E
MKMTVLLLTLLSGSAIAKITNSDYKPRMEKAIIEAIINECNVMEDLTLVNSVEEIDEVDQGMEDVLYTSTFTGQQVYDQNFYDTYDITVKTWYYDMYDHSSKEWGDYLVKSVECKMRY